MHEWFLFFLHGMKVDESVPTNLVHVAQPPSLFGGPGWKAWFLQFTHKSPVGTTYPLSIDTTEQHVIDIFFEQRISAVARLPMDGGVSKLLMQFQPTSSYVPASIYLTIYE